MRLHTRIYRKAIICLLGITKLVYSVETVPPGRWRELFDSVKMSSIVVHDKLTVLDEGIAEEYEEIEEDVRRRVGKGTLYSQEDLEEAEELVETSMLDLS